MVGSVYPLDKGLIKSQPTPLPVFLVALLDPLPTDNASTPTVHGIASMDCAGHLFALPSHHNSAKSKRQRPINQLSLYRPLVGTVGIPAKGSRIEEKRCKIILDL